MKNRESVSLLRLSGPIPVLLGASRAQQSPPEPELEAAQVMVLIAPDLGRKEVSMYAAIRQGKLKKGKLEEAVLRVKEEALPVIRASGGFRAYYLIASDDTVTTVSIFDSKAAAEASNKEMLKWLKGHFSPLLEGHPKATTGHVLVHKGA